MNKTIHYLENQELVGQPGSKHSLLTPSLLLDLDILEDNIESMAVFAKNKNIALRPHAKTHKSTKISQLQINSGALGICCATLGEAEVMILGGINGVLITSPIIQDAKIRKLSQLNNSTESLMVCVDDMQNLKNIDFILFLSQL